MANEALNRIFENLMRGEVYGSISKWRDDYPDQALAGREMFWTVLYKHWCKPVFCWRNFGESANKATKKDLLWLIVEIFGTSPEGFEQKYITRSAFREKYGREV